MLLEAGRVWQGAVLFAMFVQVSRNGMAMALLELGELIQLSQVHTCAIAGCRTLWLASVADCSRRECVQGVQPK
jgi:hypothetical protein